MTASFENWITYLHSEKSCSLFINVERTVRVCIVLKVTLVCVWMCGWVCVWMCVCVCGCVGVCMCVGERPCGADAVNNLETAICVFTDLITAKSWLKLFLFHGPGYSQILIETVSVSRTWLQPNPDWNCLCFTDLVTAKSWLKLLAVFVLRGHGYGQVLIEAVLGV